MILDMFHRRQVPSSPAAAAERPSHWLSPRPARDVASLPRTSSERRCRRTDPRCRRRAHTVAADLARHPKVTAQLAEWAVGAFPRLGIVVSNVGGAC